MQKMSTGSGDVIVARRDLPNGIRIVLYTPPCAAVCPKRLSPVMV